MAHEVSCHAGERPMQFEVRVAYSQQYEELEFLYKIHNQFESQLQCDVELLLPDRAELTINFFPLS